MRKRFSTLFFCFCTPAKTIFEELMEKLTPHATLMDIDKQHSHSKTGSYKLHLNRLRVLTACLLAVSVCAQAQTDQSNVRFTQGEVNESATLSLGVPLANYKGRGIDLPVSLSYSSNVWRLEHLSTVYNSYTYNYAFRQSITQALFAERSASGWKSTLDLPTIEYSRPIDVYEYRGKPSTAGSVCSPYRIAGVTIHMPNGSAHQLRKSDTPHQLGYVDMTGTFYAVDGSRIRFDANGTADTGTIYMPDGTKYILGHPTCYIIDRHDNTLSYNETSRQWTDTLGRVIGNPLPPVPQVGDLTYNLPGLAGVNNGLQTYTFKWRHLADALTPDAGGSTPGLRVMAKHYLPYPGWAPTNDNANPNNNYPQPQSSQYQFLFQASIPTYDEEPPYPLPTLVVGKGQSAGQLFNPVVLTEIVLPDGTSYKFGYNVYGEVAKVTYPTNAYDKYEYDATITGLEGYSQPYTQAQRNITSRKRSIDGSGNDVLEWKYFERGLPYGVGTPVDDIWLYKVTSIVAPDKTRTEIYKVESNPYPALLGFSDSRVGNVIQKAFFSSSVDGQQGNLLRREITQYEQSARSYTWESVCGAGPHYFRPITAYRNPRPIKNVSIIFEGSGAALAQTNNLAYDTTYQMTTGVDHIVTSTSHFAVIDNATAQTGAIGQIPWGGLARSTETTYLNASTYRNKNILGLQTGLIVRSGAIPFDIVSKSEMVYDEPNYSPAIGRALPTSSRVWDSTKGAVTNPSAYLTTRAKFDQYGNRTEATDAKGYTTRTTYDSTYQAYPVSVTSPVPDFTGTQGANTAFTSTTTYDPVTGLVLSATDANGQTSTMEYNDPLLRPTKATAPNGHQTATEYGAGTSETTRYVKVRSQIDTEKWSESITRYDGIARAYQTEKIDSRGNIFTKTEYDIMGRVKRSTNPYRTGEADLWSTPEYDDLSRLKKVTSADATNVQFVYGLSTTGVIRTTKTITDQAGKKRTGISDALGNTVRVIEDPDGQRLSTDYVFDTLGNLRKTAQGEQNRYFTYDSLGRVLYAKQVEQDANANFSGTNFTDPTSGNDQWSVKYLYDDNGNITTTTDARNISIIGTYDRFNRLTFRDYSDATPDVSFYYDGRGLRSIPNYSKGKTTKVASSVSETRNFSFDAMGRLLASQQVTGGQKYSFGYSYNLSGALIEETYPSGRVVRNTLNVDGELTQVQSQKNANAGFFTYADSFNYNSAGAVTEMQLGNGHWETASYNDRLQVAQIGLGLTQNTQNLLELEVKYNSTGQTDNNGSVLEQNITVPTVGSNPGFTATQSYAYDGLNRLQSATEKINTQTWKQTFRYDRYGNRRFNAANTTTLGSCTEAVCNPTINTANNRLSPGQGYSYDLSGNITQDAEGKQFLYDAENHQKEVKDNLNDSLGQYLYDGEGKRVKKISSTETMIFVYDASGQLAAEYSTQTSQTPQVSYLTTDHLGSPRVITDQDGAVISRKEFSAFGDETVTAQRTQGLGYQQHNIRRDYAGYEKDDESGLEYAQARYYNSQHGRFTSVDPWTASATIKDPQTFNRYSYVRNSPYKFVDPLGLMLSDIGVEQTTDPYHARYLANHSTYLFQLSIQPPPSPPTTPPFVLTVESAHQEPTTEDRKSPSDPGPTCPNGCVMGPVSLPTVQPLEIVLVPGNVFQTEEPRGNELVPTGVPTKDPAVVNEPFIAHKWQVSLTMRLESGNGNLLTDYEYEVSYHSGLIESRVDGRQAPRDGEAFIGTFKVHERRFGTTQSNVDVSIPSDKSITARGSITIYGSGGRIARTTFEVTVNGNNPPTVTPRAPLNWIRPGN